MDVPMFIELHDRDTLDPHMFALDAIFELCQDYDAVLDIIGTLVRFRVAEGRADFHASEDYMRLSEYIFRIGQGE